MSNQKQNGTQASHIAGGFLTNQGSPRILEWLDYHFSGRSSQPRDLPNLAGYSPWGYKESDMTEAI